MLDFIINLLSNLGNAFESVGNNSTSDKKKVLYRAIGVTLFILSIIIGLIFM
ncbi:hypothetical protein PN290_14060 [Romboutsia sp. 1001216sp1]|uniref:hypothetical protein n=1 Tax=unclassified Romboutsia TaxID=2626894 RepID=UPI00189F2DE0|nr:MULTISPECIES: hypothetical protein [unclassified Romboutsia]MDB8791356.1 hypothetical protein [Romboutsia sp. 1001216sp1]MDB8794786.1 hypothetical protein [Romboutsia sp. 1001216sp1]MDB8800490.1 hypothetical protein [Romboutsia sp. 1001216sp1]